MRSKIFDLSADDGDGGKGLPEGATVSSAVIPEDGAGPLYIVDEADQALHRRH